MQAICHTTPSKQGTHLHHHDQLMHKEMQQQAEGYKNIIQDEAFVINLVKDGFLLGFPFQQS
jgi:hypothetical protein